MSGWNNITFKDCKLEATLEDEEKDKEMTEKNISYVPEKVIYNEVVKSKKAKERNTGPTTTVYWSDESKTVVTCGIEDEFSEEVGFAMALAHKIFGNRKKYRQVFGKVKRMAIRQKNKEVKTEKKKIGVEPTFKGIKG